MTVLKTITMKNARDEICPRCRTKLEKEG